MHQAVYYSGKTSMPYPCLVKVESGFIWIYPDGFEPQQWPVGQIKHTEFKGVGKTAIRYGSFPFQTLEYEDNGPLANEIDRFLPKRQEGFWAFANELVNSGMKGAIILSILVASALGSVYFFALPFLAEKIAMNIPKDYEVEFGEKVYESLMTTEDIDTLKSKSLTKFAQRINFDSEYKLKFTVVESDMVNAFALPGGRVVVYSGIIDEMKNPEEMAALLGHEVSHINKKHSLRTLSREYSGKIFISFLIGDAGILDFFADQAQSLFGLSYSREMETEADLEGLKVLQNNKINQEGMLSLMKILQEEEEKVGVEIPQYLSTHPVSKNRIGKIQKHLLNDQQANFEFDPIVWNKMKGK